jgi:hypothetical protein
MQKKQDLEKNSTKYSKRDLKRDCVHKIRTGCCEKIRGLETALEN